MLTKPVEAAITKVIQLRRKAGISADSKKTHRGNDCLRKMSEIFNPGAIQSTLLRKQLATATQAMSLSGGMEDKLAQFMGHDIRVHPAYVFTRQCFGTCQSDLY